MLNEYSTLARLMHVSNIYRIYHFIVLLLSYLSLVTWCRGLASIVVSRPLFIVHRNSSFVHEHPLLKNYWVNLNQLFYVVSAGSGDKKLKVSRGGAFGVNIHIFF